MSATKKTAARKSVQCRSEMRENATTTTTTLEEVTLLPLAERNCLPESGAGECNGEHTEVVVVVLLGKVMNNSKITNAEKIAALSVTITVTQQWFVALLLLLLLFLQLKVDS